jgi:hypothetical protein
MKTSLLTALMAAMLAGVIFGVPICDRKAENREVRTGYLREAPISVQEQLSAKADELAKRARNAYWQADYKLAAQCYHLVIRSGRGCGNDLYNLACCYGRLGDSKLAVKYLIRSVEAGFADTELIKRDPDFRRIKDVPQFRETVEKLAREISRKSKKNDDPSSERELAVRAPKTEAQPSVNLGGAQAAIGPSQDQ